MLKVIGSRPIMFSLLVLTLGAVIPVPRVDEDVFPDTES